jgi:hypothetical protein
MLKASLIVVVFAAGSMMAQTYVGSTACSGCHGESDLSNAGYNIYATFIESGHPYKLNPVSGAPPTYPWSSVPDTPTGVYTEGGTDTTDFTWDDVTYVIGGFGWKARFIDSNGYIITGYNVQYNLETQAWGGYHTSDALGTKKYNCGRCHTTGWLDSDDGDATNNQGGLEGFVGTYAEPGIQCEACHGPGSDHVAAPAATNITLDTSSELCGNCHYRDSQHRIEYKGGFIRHHEQYDEWLHSPHSASLTCNTCHNAHASTVYDELALEDGVKMECSTCHPTQAANMNHNVAATCVDCHMPEASKSAVAETIYNGDVKTHIFRINTEPVPMDSMVYYDEADGKYFVRLDENGMAAVTLDYTCYGCHTDPDGNGGGGSVKTLEELAAYAPYVHAEAMTDTYVGSEACQACHADKYADWSASGHPYKFSIVENATPPTYPSFVVNFMDEWMDSLGTTWDNIAGVIGGFGWKARFVDQTGNLVGTLNSVVNPGGGHNQFNFFGGEHYAMGNYHPSDEKVYNYGCFRCHTTGATQDSSWLAGYSLGTFAEGGIGCEACHGPGGEHVVSPSTTTIDRVYEFDINYGNGLDGVAPDPDGNDVTYLCGTCHNRNFDTPIDAKNGFVRHHEQWDEVKSWEDWGNAHSSMSCATCHDPHKRVIWGGDGVTMSCETCHAQQAAIINHAGTTNCIDCHMPYAAKSAVKQGESGYEGDIRSHLLKITVNTETMFTSDGHYVRDDDTRDASLDLYHTCWGCHNRDPNDAAPDMADISQTVIAATGMHTESAIGPEVMIPENYFLSQNYPNPFNPTTTIEFGLPQATDLTLTIYDLRGHVVTTLVNGRLDAGYHTVVWNGTNRQGKALSSGVYFARLTTPSFSRSIKMVLME